MHMYGSNYAEFRELVFSGYANTGQMLGFIGISILILFFCMVLGLFPWALFRLLRQGYVFEECEE